MTATVTIEVDETSSYAVARGLVVNHGKASSSWLQRQMRVGYNVAARMIERMERDGIVSAPDHVGRREVLVAATGEDLASVATQAAPAPPTTPEPAPSDRAIAAAASSADPDLFKDVSADQLRLLIERIERLEEEKRGISEDIKDVYGEAKATGFDTKTMRAIIRLRKMEKHHREEAEALLETYKAALGLS